MNLVVQINRQDDEMSFALEDLVDTPVYSRVVAEIGRLIPTSIRRSGSILGPIGAGLYAFATLAGRQREWGFRLVASDDTTRSVLSSYLASRSGHAEHTQRISLAEIRSRLLERGFDKRALTEYQLANLQSLLALSHGANFSVPGAGKTTVTLALNTLLEPECPMLVISPKSAFEAWEEVVGDCFTSSSPSEQFVRVSSDLSGSLVELIRDGHRRLVINYESALNNESDIVSWLSRTRVHLVLDESHRIKAGSRSARGALALRLANLAGRRDILSGTPMPQGVSDLMAQADFLWPGFEYSRRLAQGERPSAVLAGRFVRTTKADLNLPPVERRFISCDMNPGQLVGYSLLKDRTIAQYARASAQLDFVAVRGSVIRLLQASAHPQLAVSSLTQFPDVVDAIESEGPSPKVMEACRLAREIAAEGRKVVIWTCFTETLLLLRNLLQDVGAVVVYGGNVPGGADESIDRVEALRRFHMSASCSVLVANPAAASEGLSLHHAAHEAIYVDRTYNAAHYLQSIDRIHRLGMRADAEPRITILQSATPQGIGNIDFSVSRRLALKAKNLEDLLSDRDLRQVALAEEEAPEPISESIDRDDVVDFLLEMESGPLQPVEKF